MSIENSLCQRCNKIDKKIEFVSGKITELDCKIGLFIAENPDVILKVTTRYEQTCMPVFATERDWSDLQRRISFGLKENGFGFSNDYQELDKIQTFKTYALERARLQERQKILQERVEVLRKESSQTQQLDLEPIVFNAIESLLSPQGNRKFPDTITLMQHYMSHWDSIIKDQQIPFNENEFLAVLQASVDQFPGHPDFHSYEHAGYIQKRDVKQGTRIALIGDRHADLQSVIENLYALQKKGIFSDKFKVMEDALILFDGDFTDRGSYSLEVLQILMTLKIENPENVYLVRGNHEDLDVNRKYGDENFQKFLMFRYMEVFSSFQKFYNSMPLSFYIAQEGEQREYVQVVHGAVDLSIDVSGMLADESNMAFMLVPSKLSTSLSERIQSFLVSEVKETEEIEGIKEKKNPKMQVAAKKLYELLKTQDLWDQEGVTPYTWGDLDYEGWSQLGNLRERKWCISLEVLKNYFYVSSGDKHKVKKLIKAHAHEFYEGRYKEKLLAITLPVAPDSLGYKKYYPDAVDKCLLLTVSSKCKNWKRIDILRKRGGESEFLDSGSIG